MNSSDDRVLSSVDVIGSLFLTRPDASLQPIVTQAQATNTGMAQPAVAALGNLDPKTIRVKLALFSQGRPGAVDLPVGANTNPALVWVKLSLKCRIPVGAHRTVSVRPASLRRHRFGAMSSMLSPS